MLTLSDFSPEPGEWKALKPKQVGERRLLCGDKPWVRGMRPFIPQPCCKHSCEGNINGQLFFFFFIFKATGLNIKADQTH